MSKKSYNLALVNYTNTLPFTKALNDWKSDLVFNQVSAIPAKCVDLFNSPDIDIALVPIGAFSDLQEFRMITDFGIACDGYVKTVKILSQVPIERVTKIHLDSHSRTSVELTKILMDNYWHLDPSYQKLKLNEETDAETILVIGDKIIDLESKYAYSYDLGEYWQKMTGLPFVFAVWVAKPSVNHEVAEEINNAFKSIPTILEFLRDQQAEKLPWTHDYFTNCINYQLGPSHIKGLNLFFQYLDQDHLVRLKSIEAV